jgi:hypothetical protein
MHCPPERCRKLPCDSQQPSGWVINVGCATTLRISKSAVVARGKCRVAPTADGLQVCVFIVVAISIDVINNACGVNDPFRLAWPAQRLYAKDARTDGSPGCAVGRQRTTLLPLPFACIAVPLTAVSQMPCAVPGLAQDLPTTGMAARCRCGLWHDINAFSLCSQVEGEFLINRLSCAGS